jgi:serine/threonine-protein kinase
MTLDPEHLVGSSVGAYTVDRLIGEGAFAWVFKAHRTDDGTPVALKVLRPVYAGDPQFEARFRTEFEVTSDFNHPNIVRILDVGRDGETTYFAMDFYPDSLAGLLERDGPLKEKEVIDLARGVADALEFAHNAGIIHRDIKIDNILIAEDGRALVADFGIARAVAGYVSATGQSMTIGTPHYLSPEQAQGRELDGRSDLYALGVTLYKAVTGKVPFSSTDWFELARMHVEDPPEAPRKVRPDISGRLERIILRLLAKHRDDRYPSAAHLIAELNEIRSTARSTRTFGLDLAADGVTVDGTRPKWLLPLAAVLLVVMVAIVVVLLGRR